MIVPFLLNAGGNAAKIWLNKPKKEDYKVDIGNYLAHLNTMRGGLARNTETMFRNVEPGVASQYMNQNISRGHQGYMSEGGSSVQSILNRRNLLYSQQSQMSGASKQLQNQQSEAAGQVKMNAEQVRDNINVARNQSIKEYGRAKEQYKKNWKEFFITAGQSAGGLIYSSTKKEQDDTAQQFGYYRKATEELIDRGQITLGNPPENQDKSEWRKSEIDRLTKEAMSSYPTPTQYRTEVSSTYKHHKERDFMETVSPFLFKKEEEEDRGIITLAREVDVDGMFQALTQKGYTPQEAYTAVTSIMADVGDFRRQTSQQELDTTYGRGQLTAEHAGRIDKQIWDKTYNEMYADVARGEKDDNAVNNFIYENKANLTSTQIDNLLEQANKRTNKSLTTGIRQGTVELNDIIDFSKRNGVRASEVSTLLNALENKTKEDIKNVAQYKINEINKKKLISSTKMLLELVKNNDKDKANDILKDMNGYVESGDLKTASYKISEFIDTLDLQSGLAELIEQGDGNDILTSLFYTPEGQRKMSLNIRLLNILISIVSGDAEENIDNKNLIKGLEDSKGYQ